MKEEPRDASLQSAPEQRTEQPPIAAVVAAQPLPAVPPPRVQIGTAAAEDARAAPRLDPALRPLEEAGHFPVRASPLHRRYALLHGHGVVRRRSGDQAQGSPGLRLPEPAAVREAPAGNGRR